MVYPYQHFGVVIACDLAGHVGEKGEKCWRKSATSQKKKGISGYEISL